MAAPRPRNEWADLDPIARTFGPAPLTAPPSFSAELAGRQSPELHIGALGHRVSAEAPAGLVLNLATPVASRTDGPELVTRHRVQRRAEPQWPAAARVHEEAPGAETSTPALPPPPPTTGASPMLDLPVLPSPPPPAPHLTAVGPDSRIEPVRSIAPAPMPSLVPPRSEVATAGQEEGALPLASPPRLTLGQTRRLGLGAPLNHVPSVQRAPAESANPAVETAQAQPESEPPTAHQPYVAEPNAPESSVEPMTSRVERWSDRIDAPASRAFSLSRVPPRTPSAPAPELPLAPGAQPATRAQAEPAGDHDPQAAPGDASMAPLSGTHPVVRAPGAQRAPMVAETEPAAALREGTGEPPAADMPLAPASAAPQAAAESPASEPEADQPDAASHAAEPPADPPGVQASRRPPTESDAPFDEPMIMAPILGRHPLHRIDPAPRVPEAASADLPVSPRRRLDSVPQTGEMPRALRAQRAPEAVPASLQAGLRDFGLDPGEARIHRDDGAGAEARRLSARAFTQGGEVFLPADQGSLDSTRTQALLAHELTHVAQQRRLGSSLPAENSHVGQRLEDEAQRVETSWQARSSMPLAAPARPAPPSSAGSSAVSAVSRAIEGSGSTAPAESAASSTFPPQMTELAAGEALMAQRAGAGGAAASSSSPHPAAARPPEHDLDELARQLYDRIRSRIKSELLVDRERAGVLMDRR